MANSFSSTTTGGLGVLQNYYQGPIVSQFSDSCPLYKIMEKGKESWMGSQVAVPIKVRRNQGVGSAAELGALPSIGQQTTIQALIQAKQNYLRFGVSGLMLKSAQSAGKGAFANILTFEMQQGIEDLSTQVNRELYYNGTGAIATVAANAVASNVITATGRTADEPGNKYLDVGLTIDIYTSAGALVASSLSITAVTGTTTATITLSQAVTTSATDIIVNSGSYNNDIQGLLYTLDGATTGSIYSTMDRAAYPVVQGNVVDAGGLVLSLNLMQQAYNEARRRGGAELDILACDFDTERFYTKLLIADKRYVASGMDSKVKGDGSFSSATKSYLEFGGIALVPDKDSTRGIFMLQSKDWKKYVLSEMDWAQDGGNGMLLFQIDTDAYEARLRLFANVFCQKPSAQALLKGYVSP